MDTTQRVPIAEAARRLGVSPDTVRRRIRRGELAAEQQPTPQGHVWLVDVPPMSSDPADAAEARRLRQEAQYWRELAGILREELQARRREVQALLALLERRQAQP